MSRVDKTVQALRAAMREEVRAELLAERDDSELRRAQREAANLRIKLYRVTTQRDTHRARCSELRKHIERYQRELVELRGPAIKVLPWKDQP